MPHLVQMDKKLKKKGLVLIAPECQGSDEGQIKELLKEHKAEYTVTAGIRGPNLSRGIPHMAVFDVEGKLVFAGHPMSGDAEKAIKEALKSATPPEEESSSSSGLAPRKPDLVAERAWTNSEGKAIKMTLIEVNGTIGKFRFPDGRQFEYDVTKLSAADQELIKKAQAPEAEAE